MANTAGDYIGWSVITVASWIIIAGFTSDRYFTNGGIFVLYPIFGVQLIGFSYLVSFLFTRPAYCIVFTPALLLLASIKK